MLLYITNKFILLFILLIILELLCIHFNSSLHYISKPLIISSLLFYFITQSKHLHRKTKLIVLLALIFSLLGDILLMFVTNNTLFFTLGLASFLLAHIMYILVFKRIFLYKKSTLLVALLLLIYAYYLYTLLLPNLEDLLIPVILYMLVILCMALFAFARNPVNKISYYFVLIGAILFLISDSILSLNKFYKPLFYPDITIMLSYALAQYFIVFGILKQRH